MERLPYPEVRKVLVFIPEGPDKRITTCRVNKNRQEVKSTSETKEKLTKMGIKSVEASLYRLEAEWTESQPHYLLFKGGGSLGNHSFLLETAKSISRRPRRQLTVLKIIIYLLSGNEKQIIIGFFRWDDVNSKKEASIRLSGPKGSIYLTSWGGCSPLPITVFDVTTKRDKNKEGMEIIMLKGESSIMDVFTLRNVI